MRALTRRGVDVNAFRTALRARAPWLDFGVLNPTRIRRVYLFTTNRKIRVIAERLSQKLPGLEISILTDPGSIERIKARKPSVLIVDDVGISLMSNIDEFRRQHPNLPIVLLSFNSFIGCASPETAAESYPLSKKADMVFFVTGKIDDEDLKNLFLSVVRTTEDQMNIGKSHGKKRSIFFVVDDEPRWYSHFIPLLYSMIGQRANIVFRRTYEDAEGFMSQQGDDVVCLITDLRFTREGRMTEQAGLDLIRYTQKRWPRIPIVVASTDVEAASELSSSTGLLPLSKSDPSALKTLRKHIDDFTGLGDFVFLEDMEEIARVSTLLALRDKIPSIPLHVLDYYAERDLFSTWLYMHGFRELGDELQPRDNRGESLRSLLLDSMGRKIEEVKRQPLIMLGPDASTDIVVPSVDQLAGAIARADITTLNAYAELDITSTWLMRVGHPGLADALRPIHGEGTELRRQLLQIIRDWEFRHP